jgi:DNA-binding NarL/FixJ family response regulator
LATLTATKTVERSPLLSRPYVGLLGDSVSVRRIQTVLAPEAFDVVSTGARVQALLDGTLVPLHVAVMVSDLGALGRGGTVQTVRNLRPSLPVVFVCQTDDRAAVRKALRAGVQGFVSYSNLDSGLQPTIEAVLAGQFAVPQTIRTRIAWGTFSPREKEVLQLVAGGLTNAEIACRLFLSESTVKSHLSSSFRKLGVSSRAEAAAAVLDPDTGLQPARPPVELAALEQQLLGIPPA